jgi:hypothetical protein
VQRIPQERKSEAASAESKEEFHKRRLEAMHVPSWLRSIVDVVNYCQENKGIHRGVQLLGGLAGAAIAYSAAIRANAAAGNFLPMNASWVLLPLSLPCLITYYLGSHYLFTAFYIILEALGSVLEDEKRFRVKVGEQQVRAKAKKAFHQETLAEDPGLKLPAGIKAFNAEEDEKKAQMEAIDRALEND